MPLILEETTASVHANVPVAVAARSEEKVVKSWIDLRAAVDSSSYTAANGASAASHVSIISRNYSGSVTTLDSTYSPSPTGELKTNGSDTNVLLTAQNMTGTCGPQTDTIVQNVNGTAVTQITVVFPNCGGPIALMPFAQAASPDNPFAASPAPNAVITTESNRAPVLGPFATGSLKSSNVGQESLVPSPQPVDGNSGSPVLSGKLAPVATAKLASAPETVSHLPTANAKPSKTGSELPDGSHVLPPATPEMGNQDPKPAESIVDVAIASYIMSAIVPPTASDERGSTPSDADPSSGAIAVDRLLEALQQNQDSATIGGQLQASSIDQLRNAGMPHAAEGTENYVSPLQTTPNMAVPDPVPKATDGGSGAGHATVTASANYLNSPASGSVTAVGGLDSLRDISTGPDSIVGIALVEKVVITLGTQLYTTERFSGSSTTFMLFGSRTLVIGAPAVTIADNVISAVSNGIIVNGTLYAISASTPSEAGSISTASAPVSSETPAEAASAQANSAGNPVHGMHHVYYMSFCSLAILLLHV
ncbi:MAG: hypothetical protein M1822_004133 [Bathelium mastoideum]|nr:MAG: hypothetical protein M1822_004133 [Bathelium mastoideum]